MNDGPSLSRLPAGSACAWTDGRLDIQNLSKAFGAVAALEPVNLGVEPGEFLTVVGPSGSGKTTLLRLIGGFIQPDSGRIAIGGEDITNWPIYERPCNTVFQDYALFPHMTVTQNVAFGLSVRRLPQAEIARRVAQILDIVGLTDLSARHPSQLSGGQRQRVALARAIVCEPKVLLLDEPLAALDAELRRQMQIFLKDLQRRLGVTFVLVTHDQEEAIVVSDRIAVMNKGRIEQVDTPRTLYYRPATEFVATFLGDNNLIDGTVKQVNGSAASIETPLGTFAGAASPELAAGDRAALAVRPELIDIGERKARKAIAAVIEDIIFTGAQSRVVLCPTIMPDVRLTAFVASAASQTKGRCVGLTWPAERAVIVPRKKGRAT
jgi:spermidine/putrescine transport system ATP-binding protein